MDAALLARIGLSRLRLPSPMAKLEIVHGLARALRDPVASAATWEAFLSWISALDLESEVLEALCVLVLAGDSKVMALGALRSAIRCPSILSDIFISEAFGTPILINSWAKSHSGEAPTLYSANDIADELSKGQIVPSILATRLRALEARSGKPMMKQWAYEFDRLLAKLGPQADGHWSYFSGDDRQRAVGQFIGRRGHLARSAYLRTLALAFDRWEMPEEIAHSEAMYATPVDFSFLRMLPGDAPLWAMPFHQAQPRSIKEWEELLSAVARGTFQKEDSRQQLLHLNASARCSERYQADAEVITLLFSGEPLPVEEVFRIHDWLPGHIYIERDSDWQFAVNGREPDAIFPLNDGINVLPALLPIVGRFVGYFHSDLIGRMPYLPANYSRNIAMVARPRIGGADLQFEEKSVGEFRYWNWRWSPTHDKALGTHCSVSVTLSDDCISQLLKVPKMQCSRVWRATVLSRESDYGEWQESVHYGMLPFL